MCAEKLINFAIKLLFPLSFIPLASAKENEVVNGYVKDLISANTKNEVEGSDLWLLHGHGGYLLRTRMDVNGDGTQELFLSSTLTMQGYQQIWEVYDNLPDGQIRKYNGAIVTSDMWPANSGVSTILLSLEPPDKDLEIHNNPKYYPINQFTFIFPNIDETHTNLSEEDVEALKPEREKRRGKIESILLADYLNNPNAKWTIDGDFQLDENGCAFLEESKERSKMNTDLTPQKALSLLAHLKNEKTPQKPSLQLQKPVTSQSRSTLSSNPVQPNPPSKTIQEFPFRWPMVLAFVGFLASMSYWHFSRRNGKRRKGL